MGYIAGLACSGSQMSLAYEAMVVDQRQRGWVRIYSTGFIPVESIWPGCIPEPGDSPVRQPSLSGSGNPLSLLFAPSG